MGPNKTVLLFPTNAVGVVHGMLSIADKLKQDHNFRTVFMTIGPTIGVIKDHGHELVELEERHVYEAKVGGEKRSYPGYKKWPIVTAGGQEMIGSMDAIDSFLVVTSWVGNIVLRELIDNHDAIEQTIEKIQPNLIVIDYFAAPPCVIENQQECPWVNVRSLQPLGVTRSVRADGIKPPCFLGTKLYTKEEREAMATEEPERWASLLESWKETSELANSKYKNEFKAMDEFYRSRGLVLDDVEINSPYLNIYLYPAALDYDQDDDLLVYPPSWFRCESFVRQPTGRLETQEIEFWSKKLKESMRNKKEMIYFSLGSIASSHRDLIRKYIDLLRDDDERLYVFSKGVNGDEVALNPSNMIGANYLPQTFFLEHAKLAIIHGGNNGIAECMYHGVPMIVLPMFADQLDNAQRIEDLGLGRRLDLYHCSKQQLRDAIEKLTSDSNLAQKLRSIGKRMQSSEDLDRVSSLLVSLVDNKRVDDKPTAD